MKKLIIALMLIAALGHAAENVVDVDSQTTRASTLRLYERDAGTITVNFYTDEAAATASGTVTLWYGTNGLASATIHKLTTVEASGTSVDIAYGTNDFPASTPYDRPYLFGVSVENKTWGDGKLYVKDNPFLTDGALSLASSVQVVWQNITNQTGVSTHGPHSAGTMITFSTADGTGRVAINHEDTSSQASVDNSGGTVIQDISLDSRGHLTNIVSYDLDGRYYTETESDARFINTNDVDTFSELQAIVADKTLVNEEDAAVIDVVWQMLGIELGHATDTTLARASAGEVSVEGTQLAKLDGNLQDLDAMGTSDNDGEFIVATAGGVLDWESGATARASLGLTIGTDVQPYDADLDALAINNGASLTNIPAAGITEADPTLTDDDAVTIGNNTTPPVLTFDWSVGDGTLTWGVPASGYQFTFSHPVYDNTDVLVNQTAGDARYAELSGATMSGGLNMDGNNITNAPRVYLNTTDYIYTDGTNLLWSDN